MTTIHLSFRSTDEFRLPMSDIQACYEELFAKLLGVRKFPDPANHDTLSVEFINDENFELTLAIIPTTIESPSKPEVLAMRLASAVNTVIASNDMFILRLEIDDEPYWVRADATDLPMIEREIDLQDCFDRIGQRIMAPLSAGLGPVQTDSIQQVQGSSTA